MCGGNGLMSRGVSHQGGALDFIEACSSHFIPGIVSHDAVLGFCPTQVYNV